MLADSQSRSLFQTIEGVEVSAQVFHPDERLYTLLLVDPDVPDEANHSFATLAHWLMYVQPRSNIHIRRPADPYALPTTIHPSSYATQPPSPRLLSSPPAPTFPSLPPSPPSPPPSLQPCPTSPPLPQKAPPTTATPSSSSPSPAPSPSPPRASPARPPARPSASARSSPSTGSRPRA